MALWWESVTDRAGVVSRRAIQVLDDASERDVATRHRLVRCALQQLQRHQERVDSCADRLARVVPRQVETCAAHLSSRAVRIGSLAGAGLDRQTDRVAASRRLLAAYDLERQLERGYTLTLDSAGRLLRSACDLMPGDVVSTRFADGSARSAVTDVELRAGDAEPTGATS